MRATVAAVSAGILLCGCASRPEKVVASYVSPVMYQNLTCEQIGHEATRVSARVSQVTGQQDKQATGDAVKVGVAIVLFWPAAFFVGGNDEQTAELARLKGEFDTLQQVAIQKNCGFQFERSTVTTVAAAPASPSAAPTSTSSAAAAPIVIPSDPPRKVYKPLGRPS